MYSRKTGGIGNGDYIITPPPGYDGSRFGSRSDGRDDAFPPYDRPPQVYTSASVGCRMNNVSTKDIVTSDADDVCDERKSESAGLFPFLKNGIGHEELLLIALLIVLVCEKDVSPEIILMLGLLLCI